LSVLPAHPPRQRLIFDVIQHSADLCGRFTELGDLRLKQMDHELGRAVEVAALVETSEVHVPALFVTEAANVVSRALKVGVITRQECESSFDLLHAMQASIEPID
jgi:hypothetical protein